MNNQQLSIFDQIKLENPLKDRHVCLTGKFRMPVKELKAKLMAVGAKGIRQQQDEKEDSEKYRFSPTKYIHFLVAGSEPNEEALKRFALNQHDGFHARMISENTLYAYLAGHYTEEDLMPEEIKKQISLDMSYYNWEAPIINDVTFSSRVSSPLLYDAEGRNNPISQKEIYVPTSEGIDMGIIRQLIGNLGGYANADYFDGTNIVMLSNSTLAKLDQGIKDDVILDIENKYNTSNSKIFNVQFTSESGFINWVKARMEVFPDESTIALLDKYQSQ